MLRLRFGEPFAANPLIDRALVKPFDPIARQAAAARSESQGRPDASSPISALIALPFAGSRFGRRSLALDGSEHGGRLTAPRGGGSRAAFLHRTAMLSTFALLASLPLIPPAVAAEAQSRSARSSRSSAVVAGDTLSVHIRDAARRFALSERLLRAVMHVESAGDVRAVSRKGAMGLMQIMPATWQELRIKHGLGNDPFDRRDNILAGAAYLREMLDRFGRNGFLAAYNAGPGRYEEHLSTGRPLPRETIGYVRKLAPLIKGTALIHPPARRAEDRTSAPRSPIFARTVNTWNDAPLHNEPAADSPVETVFTAIRSAGMPAPTTAGIIDLTALAPSPDAPQDDVHIAREPATRNLFVSRSSDASR